MQFKIMFFSLKEYTACCSLEFISYINQCHIMFMPLIFKVTHNPLKAERKIETEAHSINKLRHSLFLRCRILSATAVLRIVRPGAYNKDTFYKHQTPSCSKADICLEYLKH